jgi:hypothetical protein
MKLKKLMVLMVLGLALGLIVAPMAYAGGKNHGSKPSPGKVAVVGQNQKVLVVQGQIGTGLSVQGYDAGAGQKYTINNSGVKAKGNTYASMNGFQVTGPGGQMQGGLIDASNGGTTYVVGPGGLF